MSLSPSQVQRPLGQSSVMAVVLVTNSVLFSLIIESTVTALDSGLSAPVLVRKRCNRLAFHLGVTNTTSCLMPWNLETYL